MLYNSVRLHSALGYITPYDKLLGREQEIFRQRDRKLAEARQERQRRQAERCQRATGKKRGRKPLSAGKDAARLQGPPKVGGSAVLSDGDASASATVGSRETPWQPWGKALSIWLNGEPIGAASAGRRIRQRLFPVWNRSGGGVATAARFGCGKKRAIGRATHGT